jgi:DNA-binding protein HU-beta
MTLTGDGIPVGAGDLMAKQMTKSKIVATLAEQVDIPKKTSAAYLEALAAMAHKEAKNGFTIPGVGKLVSPPHKARMGRNPQTGEPLKIPARKRLRSVVAKKRKGTVGGGENVLDVFSRAYRRLA